MMFIESGYKKVSGLVLSALFLGLFAGTAAADHSPFEDALDDRYKDDVLALYEKGIIGGFPDGEFKPGHEITRGAAALMLARSLEYIDEEGELLVDVSSEGPSFSDVHEQTSYYEAVWALEEEGIISGNPDGTFGPDDHVSRGAMAIMLANGYGLEAVNSYHPFSDIGASSAEAVQALFDFAVTSGTGPDTFGTDDSMIRADFAVFVNVASDDEIAPQENAGLRNGNYVEGGQLEKYKGQLYASYDDPDEGPGLFKVQTDGSNTSEKLVSGDIERIIAYAGYLYFIKTDEDEGLYRHHLQSGDTDQLIADEVEYLQFKEQELWYYRSSVNYEGFNKWYSLPLDDGIEELHGGTQSRFILNDDADWEYGEGALLHDRSGPLSEDNPFLEMGSLPRLVGDKAYVYVQDEEAFFEMAVYSGEKRRLGGEDFRIESMGYNASEEILVNYRPNVNETYWFSIDEPDKHRIVDYKNFGKYIFNDNLYLVDEEDGNFEILFIDTDIGDQETVFHTS